MTGFKTNWNRLWSIFWTFLRIAPVSFGGGFAMIPLLEQEVVHKKGWIAQEDIADVLAVSQTIPGAVALNSASFVGYRVAGVGGAIAAALGMMLPALFIVIGLASALLAFQHNPKVAAALQGMKPAVVAMVVFAGVRISRSALVSPITVGIAVVAAVVLLLKIISPVLVILIGACVGVALGLLRKEDAQQGASGNRSRTPDPDYFIGEGI